MLDSTTTLNVGTGLSSGAYPIDAIVTGATSGAKGRIVDFDTVTGNIRIIRTSSENLNELGANQSFIVGESLTSVPGSGSSSIASIVTPEVERYTGDIIYTEYRVPIMRNISQTEDLKVIVKF